MLKEIYNLIWSQKKNQKEIYFKKTNQHQILVKEGEKMMKMNNYREFYKLVWKIHRKMSQIKKLTKYSKKFIPKININTMTLTIMNNLRKNRKKNNSNLKSNLNLNLLRYSFIQLTNFIQKEAKNIQQPEI